MEERVTALEAQMDEVGTETAEGNFGARFAIGTFERGAFGIEFFGSVLYWHAKVGGSEYVYKLASEKLNTGNRRVGSQSFDWDFGYRCGVGLRLPVLGEVVGTYTHYGSQDTEGRGVTPPSLLANLKGAFRIPCEQVSSSYKIDYDDLILELKRKTMLSRLFGLGFSTGVRQMWTTQRQTVTYKVAGADRLKVVDKCFFRGTGPRFAINGHWGLFSGFSLLADIGGSLLYGQFDVKHHEGEIELKGKEHLFSPVVDFFLGLQCDFPRECLQWSMRLGYEAVYLWRQNQSIRMDDTAGTDGSFRFTLSRNADDLTFYGLTARLGVEF